MIDLAHSRRIFLPPEIYQIEIEISLGKYLEF